MDGSTKSEAPDADTGSVAHGRCDASNRALWDAWVPVHARSSFYDVAGFRAGRSSLKPLERAALGDVRGKSILHLQCHFGLDSLSLARLGARVTGVDYSGAAISLARRLSAELGIPARFVECNVYDLPAHVDERFDLVFASYGVLHWLPDLDRWAQLVARALVEGGSLHLVEFHPFFNMFDERGLSLTFPYFPSGAPVRTVKRGACMDPEAPVEHEAYEWPHSFSELLMAVRRAGLVLEDLRETPYLHFNCLPHLVPIGDGRYASRAHPQPPPMMFYLRASRPPA
jgi:SAM-dependent methyltransferase